MSQLPLCSFCPVCAITASQNHVHFSSSFQNVAGTPRMTTVCPVTHLYRPCLTNREFTESPSLDHLRSLWISLRCHTYGKFTTQILFSQQGRIARVEVNIYKRLHLQKLLGNTQKYKKVLFYHSKTTFITVTDPLA